MKLSGNNPKWRNYGTIHKTSHHLNWTLSESHLEKESVSIENYMNRWCNAIQTPNSPTPQEDLRMSRLFSPKERDNLEKYDKFINELSVRIEGGWPPADHIPHDEDLLQLTLGLSPRVKQDKEVYPVSDIKRNWLAPQLDSDRGTESDKKSTPTVTINGER